MDATLSPETKTYLESLVSQQNHHQTESLDAAQDIHVHGDSSNGDNSSALKCASSRKDSFIQRVDVPLTFDSEFFDLIQEDLTSLDALEALEQAALSSEISALSKEIATLSKPAKFGKSDLYRWREILYVRSPCLQCDNSSG